MSTHAITDRVVSSGPTVGSTRAPVGAGATRLGGTSARRDISAVSLEATNSTCHLSPVRAVLCAVITGDRCHLRCHVKCRDSRYTFIGFISLSECSRRAESTSALPDFTRFPRYLLGCIGDTLTSPTAFRSVFNFKDEHEMKGYLFRLLIIISKRSTANIGKN